MSEKLRRSPTPGSLLDKLARFPEETEEDEGLVTHTTPTDIEALPQEETSDDLSRRISTRIGPIQIMKVSTRRYLSVPSVDQIEDLKRMIQRKRKSR